MVTNRWKGIELEVAKALDGKRVSRGDNFAQEKGDVDHPVFSIEVKYGKQVPKFCINALEQAKRYSNKPPLVVTQGYRQKKTVIMYFDDFVDYFGSINMLQDK